jgi:hypothetical protein
MKKVCLFIAGALISASVAYAQSPVDSSRTQSKDRKKGTSSAYQNYPTKDMRKLNSKDVPNSLRTTLQGSEFKGWESGSVYYNSSTNEYFYQSGNNNVSGNANQKNNNTWYRFDSQGKRIEDPRPKN